MESIVILKHYLFAHSLYKRDTGFKRDAEADAEA